MKRTFLILIGFLTFFKCLGQDSLRINSLSVQLGASYLMRQDITFSPFVHSDLSFFNLGLDYTRQAKLFQKVNIRYINFKPMIAKSYDFSVHGDVETAKPHNFNLINLDYIIGKPINKTEKGQLIIGGMFSADVQTMNYEYGRISSFGYYSGFGLGVFGRYALVINQKSRIVGLLQLPLVSWLARPPYMGIDDEFIENISSHSGFKTFMAFVNDGDLVTWNKLQAFDAGLSYQYRLNEKWEVGAGYVFEFIHSNQPQNILSIQNSLNISLIYKF